MAALDAEYDYEQDDEGSFMYKGEYYTVQNGVVFRYDGEDFYATDEVTLEMLENDADEMIEEPFVFELKVLEIKELKAGMALIHADDGAGLDFWFMDKSFDEREGEYKINSTGKYCLNAELLSAEVPENFRSGITLTGKAAEDFALWSGEKLSCGKVTVCLNEASFYEETEDFESTGIYSFGAVVSEPGFGEDVTEEYDGDCFELALKNQFNKENPRFVTAYFAKKPFKFPEFELTEEDDDGFYREGWGIAGTLRFVRSDYSTEEADENEVWHYGENGECSFNRDTEND